MAYEINIVTDYVQPTTVITTNAEYVDMVMNMAAKSYMAQYESTTPEAGITAAREAFNTPYVSEA